MELTAAFIEAIVRAIIFGFLGFAGIIAGKKFRDSRDAKKNK